MPEIKARLKLTGPSGTIADIDILNQKITGFSINEVKDVTVSSHFPGSPYLEKGVATHWNHALEGSLSFHVTKRDDTVEIISPIFYQDKSTSHFHGLPHWNIEYWRYTQGETPKRVKQLANEYIHQIEKTDWLEVSSLVTDYPIYKVRLKWEEKQT